MIAPLQNHTHTIHIYDDDEFTDPDPLMQVGWGPETLTPEHQKTLQYYVKRLHEVTGKPYPTISEVGEIFHGHTGKG